jgi:hypothetical protein
VKIARVGPALVADLEETPRPPGRFDHRPGFLEGIGHLLFAVDMKTVFQAGVGLFGMKPVGRGYDRRGQALLLGQQVAVVLVDRRILTILAEVAPGVLLAVGPDVADRGDADPGDPEARFHEDAALFPRADESDGKIAEPPRGFSLGGGRVRKRPGEKGAPDGRAQSGGRRSFQKGPSRNGGIVFLGPKIGHIHPPVENSERPLLYSFGGF